MKYLPNFLRRILPLAACALMLAGAWPSAFAATQTRSTAACIAAGGAGVAWTNPGRAAAVDASYAVSGNLDNSTTDLLGCGGYGFDIPDSATILGITVTITRRASSAANISRDATVQMVKALVPVGANRATATAYTAVDVAEAHGGAADLWGTTWTPADINGANFGVIYSAFKEAAGGNVTVSVDAIQVTVTYTTGTTTTQTSSLVNCTSLGGGNRDWTSPALAEVLDATYATSQTLDAQFTDTLQCLNYGFNIPTGSVIDGITVAVTRRVNDVTGVTRDLTVQMVKGGAATGSNLATATAYTAADVTENHGGATNLWGTTWSVAEINAANFGVNYAATKPLAAGNPATVSLDAIQVTVHYRPPTTLGDGTDPAAAARAPGGAIADLDSFTFSTIDGTDSITALTVTLTGTNSFQGLSEVRITNDLGTVTYFAAVANPASNTVNFTGGTPIPVTNTATSFRIRVTPRTHANMPLPPGATYTVGGTVTGWTGSNPQLGTDGDSATVTIDNQSPAGASATGGAAGSTQVTLNWTTSASADASGSVVLRWTGGAAGAEVPVEGNASYTAGNPIGTATVACVRTDAASTAVNGTDGAGAGGCSATALTNGQAYTYVVFQRDANGNYDTGTLVGTFTPQIRPTLVSAALVCSSATQVEVLFSVPVTSATAQTAGNYALTGGATVSTAVLGADTRSVTLTVTGLLVGSTYTLTVNNVAAVGGGAILPGSQSSFFAESGFVAGLKGTYYEQNGGVQGAANAFTGTAFDRIDPQISFNWGTAAPGIGTVGINGFSVRWQGYVTPTVSGTYTFRTRSDDGVRLYVGGATLVNNWTDHSAVDDTSAGVALTAGQYYALTMEYYEAGGDAVAELSWSGPATGGYQPIPAAQLFRCGGTTAPSTIYKMDESSWNGTAGEVRDAGPNGLHGTASSLSATKPSTSSATPALAGSPGTCNYAVFNRANKDYIALPAGFPNLGASGSFTVTAWIRTTDRTLTGQRILIDDQTEAGGWGLSLGDGGAGMVRLYSRGSSTQTLDTGAVIANNTWYFVAASVSVGANTVATLYVFDTAGALVNTTNATWTGFTWGTDNGPASIGGETNSSGEASASFGFLGNIDEVRTYAQALSQAELTGVLGQRRPCVSLLSHYAITFPNGTSGVTCEATDVLITAHDLSDGLISPTGGTVLGLSTSTGTGAWLTPAVAGSGVWSVSGSSNGIAQYTWPGGETSMRVRLRQNTVTPSLTVVPTGGIGAVENSAINFADTAFRVTANGTSSTPVGTHISGKDTNVGFGTQTLYLQAIRTDTNTGSCVGLIPGQTINVEMAAARNNPTGGSSQVSVRNSGGGLTALSTGAGALGTYGNVALTFDAQSKAPLVINYPDAGTVSVSARYQLPAPPAAVYLSGSTGSFVVRPFGFRVSGPTTAATPSPASPAFAKAGANFSVTLSAVQWKSGDDADVDGIPDSNAQIAANSLTPNFGQETSPASATLSRTLNAPSTGVPGSLGGTTSFTAFSGGARTQTVNWSEVGFIDLTAVTAADYLASGQNVASSTAGLTGVGRFYPDHFSLAASPAGTLVNRSASTCTPASTFTYMGEGFLVGFTLEARNASNAVTQNYATANGYAKLAPSTIAQLGFGARSGATVLTSRLDLSLGAAGTFTNGAAAVSATIGLQRAANPDGPYPSLLIGIAAAEPAGGDGVVMDSFDLDADGVAGNERKNIGVSTEVRFGRLRLEGRAGTSLINMRVPVETQYFTGSGFARNTADSCTALAANTFTLSDYRQNLNACETAAAAGVTVAAGSATLVLAKPGASNNGSLLLTANLGPATGNYCPSVGAGQAPAVSAARSYLQGTGAGWNVDPYARIGFGVYGSQPRNIIFMRENY